MPLREGMSEESDEVEAKKELATPEKPSKDPWKVPSTAGPSVFGFLAA